MKQSIKSLLFPRLFVKKSSKFKIEKRTEYNERNLKVTGTLPSWLSGILVRNCTVPVYEEGHEDAHFFDGLSMLHSFSIESGKVCYNSRYLQSETLGKVIQSDSAFYHREIDLEKTKNINDAAVNVFKYNNDYVALTETPLPVRFDLNNLATLGNFDFHDDLPKKNTWESAHPHYCEESNELYNYLIHFGPNTAYVLYKMSKKSSQRTVVARIPVKRPAYMHSFSMTKRYLILVECPLVVNPLRLLFTKISSFASYIRSFTWSPKQGTRFLVVEKNSGKLVSEIKFEAFFSFHHANAYENGHEIIVDLMSNNYKRLENLLPKAQYNEETMQGLQRFHLNLTQGTIIHEKALEKAVEFPTIAPHYDGKNYRYLYMVNFKGKDNLLIKYDWQQRTEISWHKRSATIIEPIFVPAPEPRSEDDGVVLTIVSDEKKKSSYLLVLDAKNLQEIARTDLPEMLPNSFHGQFFKN